MLNSMKLVVVVALIALAAYSMFLGEMGYAGLLLTNIMALMVKPPELH